MSFNKLLVCLANEGTGAAFSFRLRQGYAETSREWIEDSSSGERYKRLFVAFGAFHFVPKEDAANYEPHPSPREFCRRSRSELWRDEAVGDGGLLYEMRTPYVANVVGIRKQQDL